MFRVVLLATSMLNLSTSGPASDAQKSPVPGWLVSLVAQGTESNLEKTQLRLTSVFDQVTNGSGVASYELFKWKEAALRAQRRSMLLSSMLTKDINGDGTITKDELDIFYAPTSTAKLQTNLGITVTPTKEQQAEILQKAEEKDFKLDTNGDGRITFEEMLQDANKKLEGENVGSYPSVLNSDKLMMLDANSDGVVTRDEYLASVTKAYKQVDTNGDGIISQQEMRAALASIGPPK
ncbi:MAG TPA: EF-hand domain-containing protein [Ensifer sp.]|nr:EF-hand domain-containing protein [Ensifer sp.]